MTYGELLERFSKYPGKAKPCKEYQDFEAFKYPRRSLTKHYLRRRHRCAAVIHPYAETEIRPSRAGKDPATHKPEV
jgi:hypothetical protein